MESLHRLFKDHWSCCKSQKGDYPFIMFPTLYLNSVAHRAKAASYWSLTPFNLSLTSMESPVNLNMFLYCGRNPELNPFGVRQLCYNNNNKKEGEQFVKPAEHLKKVNCKLFSSFLPLLAGNLCLAVVLAPAGIAIFLVFLSLCFPSGV